MFMWEGERERVCVCVPWYLRHHGIYSPRANIAKWAETWTQFKDYLRKANIKLTSGSITYYVTQDCDRLQKPYMHTVP